MIFYTSSAKARNQGHDDIQMAASTTAGSASKSSDKEQLIRKFVEEFQRRPRMRSINIEERRLAGYIQRDSSNIHPETITMLNDLNDPVACAAFANSHLMQLANHTCSPPDDLMRILQVIAQVPSQSVILKEKFEFVREKAKGPGETKRQTVRWRNSGIQLQPLLPTNWNNGIAEKGMMPLPLLQYCLMHAVHEEVRDCLSGMHILFNPRKDCS